MKVRKLFSALSALLLLPSVFVAHAQQPAKEDVFTDKAWFLLTEAIRQEKPPHERIQALAALSAMGSDPRAAKLIAQAMTEKDLDIRTAAILAAGQTRNPELIPALRSALDDDRAPVAFAAAMELWKMHDDSGEDLLMAVVSGERKDKLGLIAKEKHKAARDLHRPSVLTEEGVNAASGFFLGPFGFGIKAIELAKKNGGDPGRGDAVNALAQQHSDLVHKVLIDALTDKDSAVRAVAARDLGHWPGQETADTLLPLFGDDKLAVRLSAASGYVQALDPHPVPPDTRPAGPPMSDAPLQANLH